MDIEQRATLYKMLFMGIVIAIPLLVWNHYDFQNDWQTFMKVLEESNK